MFIKSSHQTPNRSWPGAVIKPLIPRYQKVEEGVISLETLPPARLAPLHPSSAPALTVDLPDIGILRTTHIQTSVDRNDRFRGMDSHRNAWDNPV